MHPDCMSVGVMESIEPATTRLNPRSVGMGAEQICSPVGCIEPSLVDQLTVVFVIGAFALLFIAVAYICEARWRCTEERSRTRTERDAFEQFRRRLTQINADPGHNGAKASRTDPGSGMLTQIQIDGQQLTEVRRAYRETVMAVEHYQEDYGETLAENMRAEFGAEIATAVTDGGGLTPQLKQALLQGCEEAIHQRDELLTTLDEELETLEEAESAFENTENHLTALNKQPLPERSFKDLVALWDDLDAMADSCAERIDERQRELQESGTITGRISGTFALHNYLYGPLEVNHPILADGTALLDRIETAKHRVSAALTRRA